MDSKSQDFFPISKRPSILIAVTSKCCLGSIVMAQSNFLHFSFPPFLPLSSLSLSPYKRNSWISCGETSLVSGESHIHCLTVQWDRWTQLPQRSLPILKHTSALLDGATLIHPLHSSFSGWECTPLLSKEFQFLNLAQGRTWNVLSML